MKQVADEVARWLGIFTTGTLMGEGDERSLERAAEVLGEARLGELREWFENTPPDRVRDAKCAVIEVAIAVAHADKEIADPERELVGRLVQLAELDEDSAKALNASLETRPVLEQVTARITHPSLRELALVIAWQVASADASIDEAERGLYGELSKRLSVEPERAKALRALFEG
jgi:tellurite resistance protein